MKKIFTILVAAMLATGTAWAEMAPTEEDYKSLDEFRAKLIRMRREMDKFMKEVVVDYPNADALGPKGYGADVKVDVIDGGKDIVVKADLPGMDKDKINISLEEGRILKISGSREVIKRETAPGVVRQERMSGNFERVLKLPAECKTDGIDATYKNGVLEITIPKKEKLPAEEVKIKVK